MSSDLVVLADHVARTPPKGTSRNPYLDAAGVAALLTELRGTNVEHSTVRRYKSRGMLPIPDIQEGGEPYQPDALIPVLHRAADPARGIPAGYRFPLRADPKRPWTEPERERARAFWRRSTIVTWNASRRGQGYWGRRTPGDATAVVIPRRREEGALIAAPA